ncbi:Bug family tripartite tricarboxylate transporter substrate binding protein [Bosea sp. RAC05]|uniref:Bug family tripartite tricarboxylate transporter substrate binding protein n=1 Tax=Bosea sp. RAC05 TaxID=1842539 RepID=UPI000855C40E|nr:tripartite tricarboxylate transporter substrate binding protein [Bosea sp. RAC05]AOG06141.1 tripartite tricarboxylate transporter receptor family protein [Bosea sp. RAC05]
MAQRSVRIVIGLLGAFWLGLASGAGAQSYPDRPIKLVMPFGPGSASDTIARIVADRLGEQLGQRVLVENRAGAGGNIGTQAVAKAEPDGYTLIFAAPGPFVLNPSLGGVPYDPEKDFELISPVATLVNVLVVNPAKVPVANVREFIAHVKKQPGAISYSSVGLGSSQHLAAAYFDIVAGTKMVHVPYRSGSQIALDLVSGDVPVSFQLIPNVVAQLQAGQVKPLAVTTTTRSKALPDVPTMAEAGVANYESYAWFGLAAPKGTPATVLERLSREVRTAVADAAVQKRLIDIGVEPFSSSPAEFKAFVASELAKWSGIIKEAGITSN